MEEQRLPESMDYGAIGGLSAEVVEKLTEIQPANIGQARRISESLPPHWAPSCTSRGVSEQLLIKLLPFSSFKPEIGIWAFMIYREEPLLEESMMQLKTPFT